MPAAAEALKPFLLYVGGQQVRVALGKHRGDMIMTLLGLRRCADTIVGNERVRGG